MHDQQTSYGRISKTFIDSLNHENITNCELMPEIQHDFHTSNRLTELWQAQVERSHMGNSKPFEFNADVCDFKHGCHFFKFYLNEATVEERYQLMLTVFKQGRKISKKVRFHWKLREKCCSTFTDLNIKFGMLSHARGLYYRVVFENVRFGGLEVPGI